MGVNVLCAIRFSEYRQWRLASIAFGLKQTTLFKLIVIVTTMAKRVATT